MVGYSEGWQVTNPLILLVVWAIGAAVLTYFFWMYVSAHPKQMGITIALWPLVLLWVLYLLLCGLWKRKW